jgi:hypothetical protein
MYLRALCFNVATVAVMLTSVCYAEFCDDGPTGKYCFDDLTGYHDCVLDNSTGKFVDYMVHCPRNTRYNVISTPLPPIKSKIKKMSSFYLNFKDLCLKK